MRTHDSAVCAVGRAAAVFKPNHCERARGAATTGQTIAPLVDAGASRQRHATSIQNAAAGGAATRKVPNRCVASVECNIVRHWFLSFHGPTFCVDNFTIMSSHRALATNAAVRTEDSCVWSVVSHLFRATCGAIGRRYRNVVDLFAHT